jgi:starch synthase
MEPYLPASEIATTMRILSQGVQDKGYEIRTFLPRHGCVNERRNQLHEVIRLSGMNLIINEADHPLIIKVASLPSTRMQVYFIDNEDYFQGKPSLYGPEEAPFKDNDERTIFFARGVLETVKKLRWSPHVVHCHGWFSALLPIFLKKVYKDDPLLTKTKIVISLYDEEFEQPLDIKLKKKIIIGGIKNKDVELLSEPTYENLMKLAINHADGVILGNPNTNKQLEKYTRSLKKPILTYKEKDYVDTYNSFYAKILSK